MRSTRPPAPPACEGVLDVVTIGETMASFIPLGADNCYVLRPIGAESNVAVGVAALGLRARWVSRLGDDGLGRSVACSLAEHGVDVCADRSPDRPTGVLVKDFVAARTHVRYYRDRSAASTLGPDDAQRVGPTRWLHVTGITPALSRSCAQLIRDLVDEPPIGLERVSFDVNYRPVLWQSAGHAADVLLSLARQADLIFIGDDEARALLGTEDESVIRRELLIRDGQQIVCKRGPAAATVLSVDGDVTEPALVVDLIDLTGAGDAFAAGFLAGTCWGWAPDRSLRLAHACAARVVAVTEDLAPILDPSEVERLVASTGLPIGEGRRSL